MTAKRRSSQSGSAMMLMAAVQPEATGDLEGLPVLVGRRPLAQALEPFLVERLDPEEHVVQPQSLPVREHLLVLDQDVAAGLEVVLLLDSAALDLPADGEAVLGMDEGDIVDEEHVRLGDAREILGGRLRRGLAIAPAVERPRAAERAVPRAAARELGRGAGIEHADEILVPPPGEVARGLVAVQVFEKCRARSRPMTGHHARQGLELGVADCLEEPGRDHLALAAHHDSRWRPWRGRAPRAR